MGVELHHLPETHSVVSEVPPSVENCGFMVILGCTTKGVFLEEEGLVPGLKLWQR